MHKRTRYFKGFSLVELAIAIGLAVSIFAGGFYILMSLVKSTGALNLRIKAERKLSAVEEQLRLRAAAMFDTMDETNANRTGTIDRKILVYSTVGPIDPVTRTRRVNLTAEYKVGDGPWNPGVNVRTLTRTFDLGKVTAQLAGAAVTVKVVSSFRPNVGVPGVQVSVPGEGTNKLEGLTGTEGDCVLYGVKIAPEITMTLDGTFLTAYFPNPNSYQKSVTVYNTREGVLVDAGTYLIVNPGSLKGKVVNAGSGGDIPSGVWVTLAPNNARLPFPISYIHTQTNGDGEFEFPRLLPCVGISGCYYALITGNNIYTAADIVDSFTEPVRQQPQWDVDTEMVTSIPDMQTIKRGSLQGTLTKVVYNPGTGYQDSGAVPDGIQIGFTREIPGASRSFSNNSVLILDWRGSLVGVNNWVPYNVSIPTAATQNGDGTVLAEHITPLIVSQLGYSGSYVHPLQEQGDIINVNADKFFLNPGLTPILVRLGDNPHPVKFKIQEEMGGVAHAPVGIQIADFQVKMFTDGLTRNPNQQWKVLARNNNTLSNLTGTIRPLNNPGDNFAPQAQMLTHYVQTIWDQINPSPSNRAIGGIRITSGYARVIKNLTVTAQRTGDDQAYSFNFSNANPGYLGEYCLIPSLAGESQMFIFSATAMDQTLSKNFYGNNMLEYYKDVNGNRLSRLLGLNGPPIDLTFIFNYLQGGEIRREGTMSVNVENGAYNFDRAAVYNQRWSAEIVSTLSPGESTSADANATKQENSYRDYYLRVEYIPNTNMPPYWHNGLVPAGVLHRFNIIENRYTTVNEFMSVNRVGRRQLIGTIRDSVTRNPILSCGAVIRYGGTGMGTGTSALVNSDGTFDITTPDLYMAPGNNVWMKAAECTGYIESEWVYNFIYVDNVAWSWDFLLTPAGSGGSGPGQGGSG